MQRFIKYGFIMGILTMAVFQLLAQNGGEIKGREPMTHHVEGRFSVKLDPQKDEANPANLGRMIIDKVYEGDLSATGKGQMLTGITAVQGSAGYVAMELVQGRLKGRTGSFLVQHSGTMAGGTNKLSIIVVPDSGTGELKGISGHMDIKIEQGLHFYIFDYSLPEQSPN